MVGRVQNDDVRIYFEKGKGLTGEFSVVENLSHHVNLGACFLKQAGGIIDFEGEKIIFPKRGIKIPFAGKNWPKLKWIGSEDKESDLGPSQVAIELFNQALVDVRSVTQVQQKSAGTGHGKKGETKLSSPFSFSVPGREGQVVATMKTIPVPPEQMDLPYICSAGTINDRIKLEDTLSTPFYTDDGLKCFNICVVNYGGEGAHVPSCLLYTSPSPRD